MIKCNIGGIIRPCGKRAEHVTQLVCNGEYVMNSMWIVCDEHLALWHARDRGEPESGDPRPRKPLPPGWERETARICNEKGN